MYKKLKEKLSPKPARTKQQVDQEYRYHALNVGHKDRLISQLQEELEDHRKALVGLYLEGTALPAEAPKAPTGPVAMTEGSAS